MREFAYVSCLVLVAGSIVLGQAAPTGQGEAVIQHLSGSVRITDANGVAVTAARNVALKPGWTIETGRQSTVDCLLKHNGATIALSSNARLVLSRMEVDEETTAWTTTTLLNLQQGELLGKTARQMPGSTFGIRTPKAYLEVLGCEFFVDAQSGEVHVTEGLVAVNLILSLDNNETLIHTVEVAAGQSLLMPTRLASSSELSTLKATATPPSLSASRLAWLAQHTPRFQQYSGNEVNVVFEARLNRNGSITVFKAPTVTPVSP